MQSWMGVPDGAVQLKIHWFPLSRWYSNGALRRSPHRDLSGDRKGGWDGHRPPAVCTQPPSPLSTVPSIRAAPFPWVRIPCLKKVSTTSVLSDDPASGSTFAWEETHKLGGLQGLPELSKWRCPGSDHDIVFWVEEPCDTNRSVMLRSEHRHRS